MILENPTNSKLENGGEFPDFLPVGKCFVDRFN